MIRYYQRIISGGICLLALYAGGGKVLAATQEPTGLSFYVMRVIYPEDARQGASLTAYNKTSTSYLMQSRIYPVDLKTGGPNMTKTRAADIPFIVTPPLARLDAKGELTLRIRRSDVPLPTDRESVFFISMKAIPAQVPPEEQTGKEQRMVLTVVSNIKLFYRPAGLNKRALIDTDISSQLHFRREGNSLIAENPTPYWLTFSRLSLGAFNLDKSQLRLMVPPKGEQRYTVPEDVAGELSWTLIDEDGWDTPVEKQVL